MADKPLHFYTGYSGGELMGNVYRFNGAIEYQPSVNSGHIHYLEVTPIDWAIGVQDFTIEFWIKFDTLPVPYDAMAVIGGFENNGLSFYDAANGLALERKSNGYFVWKIIKWKSSFAASYIELSTEVQQTELVVETGVWYWMVFERQGDYAAIYQNGTQIAKKQKNIDDTFRVDDTYGWYDPNLKRQIGSSGGAYYNSGSNCNYSLIADLDELRVSVGIARYGLADSIPVQSEKFGAPDAYTKFLLHCDGVVGTQDTVDECGHTITYTAGITGHVAPNPIVPTVADKPLHFYSRETAGGTNFLTDSDAIITYLFNESAGAGSVEDSIGSNDGVLDNAAETTQGIEGQFDKAIYFQGTVQASYVSPASQIGVGSNVMSVCVWTKGEFRQNYTALVMNPGASPSAFFSNAGSNKLNFNLKESQQIYGLNADNWTVEYPHAFVAESGNWIHWVMVIDKSTPTGGNCGFKLYKNAVLQTTWSFIGTNSHLNNNDILTNYWDVGYNIAGGGVAERMDEFAIFKRELSQEDITKIYEDGLQGGAGTSDKPIHFYSAEL